MIRLLAYNIRSLWNVGSIFRSCDAFAVEKFYLTGYTGHPPRKEITKTALGAEEFVPWEQYKDPLPVIQKLKEEGWHVVALELHPSAIPLSTFQAPDNILLIIGHELDGIPESILTLCDSIIEIPMMGQKESLNVAVATGIALCTLTQ
ncbi:RNA methyltransferase [Candidatus Peregrinibacteria bacterium CG10_big_fil_rev_8_21_14_0_10_49_16]|nr:MAG: RNA methyltransferase [Candidatus Peregrinibacteria bacterium CG22_combo_CG10-13_8_21_14_all_49_11]PIR52487.1 MAG: RNA methyltransferase [Candidatus Peregrinibacteria bacterium CG10_big_fil_rev_8_21_14_0_10_49_16]